MLHPCLERPKSACHEKAKSAPAFWCGASAPASNICSAIPADPYWGSKDAGAWSIPKGAVEGGHDLLATAQREFAEETGLRVNGPFMPLQPVKQTSGKIVHAFAVEANLDLTQFAGGHFEMEWPPRSGRKQSFPEFDHIGYFPYPAALEKIIAYQRPFLVELNRKLERE